MPKNTEFGLADCGARQEFSTGSRRDTQSGKPRPDLISPLLKIAVGNHLMLGAIKYSEGNWSKGQPSSRYAESLERHLVEASLGLEDEDHLSAIVFNAMGLIHNREMKAMGMLPKELDDWPLDWIGTINGEYPQQEETRTPEQIKAQLAAAVTAKVKYMQELRNKLVAAYQAKRTNTGTEAALNRKMAVEDNIKRGQIPKKYSLLLGGNKMAIVSMPGFLDNLEGLPVTDGSGAIVGKVERTWVDGNFIKARFSANGEDQEVTLYEITAE